MVQKSLVKPVKENQVDTAGRWKFSSWCTVHDRFPDECWEIHAEDYKDKREYQRLVLSRMALLAQLSENTRQLQKLRKKMND